MDGPKTTPDETPGTETSAITNAATNPPSEIRFGPLTAHVDPSHLLFGLTSYQYLFSQLGLLTGLRIQEQIDDPEMLPELLKRQREQASATTSEMVDALGQSATLAILRTAREILDEYLVEAEAFVAIRRKNGHFE